MAQQIKKYELEDHDSNAVHFDVNTSKLTKEKISEIADFFDTDAQVESLLRAAFITVIEMMRRNGWEVINSATTEDFNIWFNAEEGWGDSGINLTYASALPIDTDTISVRLVS